VCQLEVHFDHFYLSLSMTNFCNGVVILYFILQSVSHVDTVAYLL